MAGYAAAGAALNSACSVFRFDPTTTPASSVLPTEETSVPTQTSAPASTAQPTSVPTPESLVGKVSLVKTNDRAAGTRRALDLLSVNPVQGKHVFLKPNYNSSDPAPGSTHPDVLRTTTEWLQDSGAETITVGDRSGMGNTRRVMQDVGVFELADEMAFNTVVFDDLDADGWVMQEAGHWSRGFAVARPVAEAESVVQACCLKTHRFGGHFTLSLKNSVGIAAKQIPGDGYDYMTELHRSANQRTMIAEINAAYAPDLVVMDGVEAFTSGGPERGTTVQSQVVLAGADRIALDAVGVALLRYFGTTSEVASGPIFQLEQIARAVELGLGVTGPEGIEFVTDDPESAAYAEELRSILLLN